MSIGKCKSCGFQAGVLNLTNGICKSCFGKGEEKIVPESRGVIDNVSSLDEHSALKKDNGMLRHIIWAFLATVFLGSLVMELPPSVTRLSADGIVITIGGPILLVFLPALFVSLIIAGSYYFIKKTQLSSFKYFLWGIWVIPTLLMTLGATVEAKEPINEKDVVQIIVCASVYQMAESLLITIGTGKTTNESLSKILRNKQTILLKRAVQASGSDFVRDIRKKAIDKLIDKTIDEYAESKYKETIGYMDYLLNKYDGYCTKYVR